ncbi:MAG: P1 family peptidase [Ignavibacteriae bacterium]|nr:S58 family peptidase [Ignavibacteriota bacterium]NOG99081.1 P1 family peptidase [Ignavibacteriota bacterium]
MTYILTLLILVFSSTDAQTKRARDYGIKFGKLPTGLNNAITDVEGVLVGHETIIEEDDARTGVTAILPYAGNVFQNKVPAAIFIANGFGKLTAISQVEELGNIETPIILTNTLSVPTAADALIDYTFTFSENDDVRSVNPVVGETNDGGLNNIQARYVKKQHVLNAIKSAEAGSVAEGNVGAGTGTICFGFKGGIGTSSRVLPEKYGGYTVGVLVQTNFGGDLLVAGIPVEEKLKKMSDPESGDGSVMIIIATDAPLKSRNLKRLAKRSLMGIARTGGNCSNGSGEYAIAFSTAENLRSTYKRGDQFFDEAKELRNDRMTPLFTAVIEAAEEAVINSLFAAETMTGVNNRTVQSLPVQKVIKILESHNIIVNDEQ